MNVLALLGSWLSTISYFVVFVEKILFLGVGLETTFVFQFQVV